MAAQTRALLILLLALLLQLPPAQVDAREPAFDRLWNKTDGRKRASGAWSWGPGGWAELLEPYQEAPGGLRSVRYYDKARMELTNPYGDQRSPWHITTGLLVVELVSGQVQLGDALSQTACPEQPCGLNHPIAGDPLPQNPSPRYVELAPLISSAWDGLRAPSQLGQPADQQLRRLADQTLALTHSLELATRYPETAAVFYDQVTAQNIPRPFWSFMAQFSSEPLFLFGHPISAPYWTRAIVAGKEQDVLMQLFERRALTYTPKNPLAWQVEMGNVGQHYYQWRYQGSGAMPWLPIDNRGQRIPIVTYHYVSESPNPQDELRTALSVTPVDFEAQLRYLVGNGYTAITLDDLLAARAGAYALPPRPIILTFDDAYADFYSNAFPLLQRYQLKATLYVPTDKLGDGGYMTWEQVVELSDSPLITMAGHTRRHPDLTLLTPERMRDEIVRGKAILEERIGLPVAHFCYPYGKHDDVVEALVRQAGFLTATTTHRGAATVQGDMLTLPRIGIVGSDRLEGFVKKLDLYARPPSNASN